ncbi:RNA ligase/cyclic nucleotide phosphodiesterase, partial [Cantharellus anzutake]|uniref:RNA ligase/cyclic nucleotide phosphodiesterase n=1 Tax=Cantharellus anzutake TaxID=1750568 RepID=UPI0019054CCD
MRANVELYPKASIPPVESLHITLKFIGEVDEARVPSIIASLSHTTALRERHSSSAHGNDGLATLNVSVDKVGIFSRTGVVYANVVPTPALSSLASFVESTLHTHCSFPRDNRPYHPHITLARIRRARGRGATQNSRTEDPILHGFVTQSFVASSFALYRSHRAGNKADDHPSSSRKDEGGKSNVYEILHSWDFELPTELPTDTRVEASGQTVPATGHQTVQTVQ